MKTISLFISTAVLLVACFVISTAASSITVNNNCGFEVRCMVVSGAKGDGTTPPGATFDGFTPIPAAVFYASPPPDLGQTILCGTPEDLTISLDKIIQLEFTHSTVQQKLNWDVSVFVATHTESHSMAQVGSLRTLMLAGTLV